MNSYKELYISALRVSSLIDSLNVAHWLLKIARNIVQIDENYSNKSFLTNNWFPWKIILGFLGYRCET